MDYTTVDHPDDSDSLVEISSDQNPSSPVTPKSDTIPVNLNFDHHSRSDVSPNHDDSDYFSYSELVSEAEAFYSTFNHNLLSSGDMDDHDLAAKKQRSFGVLMKKNAQLEEELRTMSLKLQESEQENEKLKAEAEKRELLVKNLNAEFDFAVGQIHLRDTYLETGEEEVLELEQVLEDQIRDYDAGKMEMQRKEFELQAEINALRIDLALRNEHVEALNKDFDKYKHRYDMLMVEKDGVYANLDNLKAEMRSKDIQIEQMEKQLNQLHSKQTELVSESGVDKNTVEELRVRGRVHELEKQVELQKNVIAEAEEEKREAIRQLCFCLDHYQSGYKQLLRNKKQQQRNHGRLN